MNLQIEILPNGNLALSVPDYDDRTEIVDMMDDLRGYWAIMAELLEPYSTNGSFAHFDGGDANPYVGLTTAPCIAEEMHCNEAGMCEILGRCWYFDDNGIMDDLGMLANGETVIYQLIQ